jgi:hypothetical protein
MNDDLKLIARAIEDAFIIESNRGIAETGNDGLRLIDVLSASETHMEHIRESLWVIAECMKVLAGYEGHPDK